MMLIGEYSKSKLPFSFSKLNHDKFFIFKLIFLFQICYKVKKKTYRFVEKNLLNKQDE